MTAGKAKRAAGGPLFDRRSGEEDRWWLAFGRWKREMEC